MKMSRVETAMRAALKFYEAFNRHDVAGMMQLVDDDCLFESSGPAPDGAVHAGKEAVARCWHDFFQAAPRAQVEIEDIFGLGMRCVVRWRVVWPDASGEQRHLRGVDILRVRNDLICERLSYVKGEAIANNQ